jgi:hypothetical protein
MLSVMLVPHIGIHLSHAIPIDETYHCVSKRINESICKSLSQHSRGTPCFNQAAWWSTHCHNLQNVRHALKRPNDWKH